MICLTHKSTRDYIFFTLPKIRECFPGGFGEIHRAVMAGMGGNDASCVIRGQLPQSTVVLAMAVVNRWLRGEMTARGTTIIVAPPIPRHVDTQIIRKVTYRKDITEIFATTTFQIYEAIRQKTIMTNTQYSDFDIFREAYLTPDAFDDEGMWPGVHLKAQHMRALAAEPLAAVLQPLLQKK